MMSSEDQEAQRRSFAFGNCAIDNPNVTRETVDRAARNLADIQAINSFASYLLNAGATIESASGKDVTLDSHLCLMFDDDGTGAGWAVARARLQYMIARTLTARVHACLVPPEHITKQVAKFHSADSDGNLIKVKMSRGMTPEGHVLKIGNDVYGIISSKALTSRHRLLLDRPISKDTRRGSPIYGCTVPQRATPFKGITIVSSAFDDEPGVDNNHIVADNLHVRITRKLDASIKEGVRCTVEILCGLIVDPTVATLR